MIVAPTATPAHAADLVDAAVAGKFTTFVAAVKAAGLADMLKGAGPFTVFAPTDDAFATLPTGTLDDLLKPENKPRLQAILKRHVVVRKVMAADLARLHTAKTTSGQDVVITATNGKVTVDGAHVTRADIAASNGVIHAIDAVMLPKQG